MTNIVVTTKLDSQVSARNCHHFCLITRSVESDAGGSVTQGQTRTARGC